MCTHCGYRNMSLILDSNLNTVSTSLIHDPYNITSDSKYGHVWSKTDIFGGLKIFSGPKRFTT